MGGTYHQSTGSILAASPDRDSLVEYTDVLKHTAKRSGGEFRGPEPLPVARVSDLHNFLIHIGADDEYEIGESVELRGWLFGVADSQEIIDQFAQLIDEKSPLFARRCEAIGEESIRKAFSMPAPEDVFVVAELGSVEHPKNFGHDPHTYDPNLDYVTDR